MYAFKKLALKSIPKTYSNLPAGDYEFKVVHKGEWYGFEKLDTEIKRVQRNHEI